MRRAITLACFVLASLASWAQFTTVTGTVTDPNGLPYAYGTISSQIVSSGTPIFSATGALYIQPTQATGFDINGTFQMRLADVTALTPGGSTYTFTVCSGLGTVQPAQGTGPVCFTVTGLTISGATQSITSNLVAVAPALAKGVGTNLLNNSALAIGSTQAPAINLNCASGGSFSSSFGTMSFAVGSDTAGDFEWCNSGPTTWALANPLPSGATAPNLTAGNLAVANTINSYNGFPTAGGGVAFIAAQSNSTGLTSNFPSTTLYTVPASGAGLYRLWCYEIVSTVASSTSTLPNCLVTYTDRDSGGAVTITIATGNTNNNLTSPAQGSVILNCANNTAINMQSTGYASNAAGMTYVLRARLEDGE